MEVPYSFQVDNPKKYIIPAPVNLPANVPARWLSDVVVMNPVCTWGTPRLNTTFIDSSNLSHTVVDIENADLTVYTYGNSMLSKFSPLSLQPVQYSSTYPVSDQSITLGSGYISNTTDTG